MNKNDIMEFKIEDIGTEGEGIGHADGYTLFVKDAVPGDLVRVKIIKMNKSYGYARIEEILEPSPDRTVPKCPVARQCGGCQIQQMSYDRQLRFKEERVQSCISRIGKIGRSGHSDGDGEFKVSKILGMKEPWHYRNKAQFPVGADREGKVITGFYAGRTHSIIDSTHCYIQAEVNEKILGIICSFMEKNGIKPYDEESGKGLVRHVLTRVGFASGEIGICIIINGYKLPHAKELCTELCDAVPGIKSISLNVNTKKTNVILGEELIPLFGDVCIYDKIGDVSFRISPKSFYQVNPAQTKVLYETALEYAFESEGTLHADVIDPKAGDEHDPKKEKEVIWDLYCGIGTISLFLAKRRPAAEVHGVEIVPAAIEDARTNAKLNGIENARFYVGAAEEVAKELPRPDVIVVDPPRKGCDEELLKTILKHAPKRVVYVSCDPATLARDIAILCKESYCVKKVQPVDQFPHSVHVETVCLLSRE